METMNKEVIEKKVYVEGDKHHRDNDRIERKAGNGFGMGLAGVITGGLALLNQWGGGRGLFGGLGIGGNGGPENVNINTISGSTSATAPTAFQAWEKACEGILGLTNEMWGLKVGTLNQMAQAREVDVAEKFGLYKSQVDADFGLYKVSRDLYDNMNDKLNASSFGLYKNQRDAFDVLNEKYAEKFNALDKKVAVMEAIRPYQDRLIQCEIDRAYTASINHCDRLDCRNIKGVNVLPNATATGFPSSCGCQQVTTTQG